MYNVERLRRQLTVMTNQVGPGLTKPASLTELEARVANEAWASGFHRGPQRIRLQQGRI